MSRSQRPGYLPLSGTRPGRAAKPLWMGIVGAMTVIVALVLIVGRGRETRRRRGG